jgi:phenylacetate-coenzyme A ligase PaaK-like adenylate-forming protein
VVGGELGHLPVGSRRLPDAPRPVRVGISGSGEALLVLAWSARELARERAAGARLLRRVGVAPGMRIANALPGGLATPGALLLGDVVEEIGALDVPLGTIDDERAARQAWELVDRVRPDVLVLPAATALLASAPPARRPWWRGILWLGAEPSTPIAPAAGFEGWQRGWLAVPEATSFVAATCAAARFHVDEEVTAEVLDPATGSTLSPGRDGALVLTPRGVDAPLVRYATGVTARLVPAPCACGEAGVAIELP